MAKCLRCDYEDLEECESYEDNVKEYHCPHCGTHYIVGLVEESEKESYPAYNDELKKDFIDERHGYNGLCTECGRHIVWSSDFMRSETVGDVDIDDVDENGLPVDDALVSFVICPYCGCYTEIIEPKPSETGDYPYWDELNKSKDEERA